MNEPAFNLAMAAKVGDSWYQHLSAVEAAMAAQDRIDTARFRAGWSGDEGGWYSPDGIHESDWELEGHPFPEDDNYATFWHAYIHSVPV